MVTPRVKAAGGFAAMKYVLAKGRSVGTIALYKRMRSKNACKTCAVGMGGQSPKCAKSLCRHRPPTWARPSLSQTCDASTSMNLPHSPVPRPRRLAVSPFPSSVGRVIPISVAHHGRRQCAFPQVRSRRPRPIAASSTQVDGQVTKLHSCFRSWPAPTARTTSTTVRITATRHLASRSRRFTAVVRRRCRSTILQPRNLPSSSGLTLRATTLASSRSLSIYGSVAAKSSSSIRCRNSD